MQRNSAWRYGIAFAQTRIAPERLRSAIYRKLGVGLRSDVGQVRAGLWLMSPRFSVGKGSFINYDCFVENEEAWVRIGQNCQIGMRVVLCTATHTLGPHEQRGGPLEHADITISDGVWIGAAATVLPGVTIGEGCVVAAGAVVTRDCEPDGLYAGVPARRIRDLT